MYPQYSDPAISYQPNYTQSVSSPSVSASSSLVGSVQPFYPQGHPQAVTQTPGYHLLHYQPNLTNNNPTSPSSSSWTSNPVAMSHNTSAHYHQSNQSHLYPNSSSISSTSSQPQPPSPYQHYHQTYPHPHPQHHYFFPTSMANPFTPVSSPKQKIVVLFPSCIDIAKLNVKQIASAACDALERNIPLEDMLITVSVTPLIDSAVSDTFTVSRSMEDGVSVSDSHVNSDYALESSPDPAISAQSDPHHLLPSQLTTSTSLISDDSALPERNDSIITQPESDNVPLPSSTLPSTTHDQLEHDINDMPASQWDTSDQNMAQNSSDSVNVEDGVNNITDTNETIHSSASVPAPTTNDTQRRKRQFIPNASNLSDAELIARRAWDPKNSTVTPTAPTWWNTSRKWGKANNKDTPSNRYDGNRSHRPSRDNHSAPEQQRHSSGFSQQSSSSRNKRQTHISVAPENNTTTFNDNKARGNDNRQNRNSMNDSEKRGKNVKVSESGSMTASMEISSESNNKDKKNITSRPSHVTIVSHSSGNNHLDDDMSPHRVVLGNVNASVDISDMERLAKRTTSLERIHYPPKKPNFPGRAAVFFFKDPEDAMRFYVHLQTRVKEGSLPTRFALPNRTRYEVRINMSSIPAQIAQRYQTGGRDNHNNFTTTQRNTNADNTKPIHTDNNSDLQGIPLDSLKINNNHKDDDTNQVTNIMDQDNERKLEKDSDTVNDSSTVDIITDAMALDIPIPSSPSLTSESSYPPNNDVKSLSHSSGMGMDDSLDSKVTDDITAINVSESSSSSLAAA